jgi:DNA polymerase
LEEIFLNKRELMKNIEDKISICNQCTLCETRSLTVPGEGDINSPVVFIGEGPGADEDNSGKPFVGRAGRLLMDILKSVSLEREQVYITNIVKCRPPNNRNPLADEMKKCSHYLFAQLQVINPKLIVTLGAVPLAFLLEKKSVKITAMRGTMIDYKDDVKIMPMFHPSYLLRNSSKAKGSPKYLTWLDIKEVKQFYEEHR